MRGREPLLWEAPCVCGEMGVSRVVSGAEMPPEHLAWLGGWHVALARLTCARWQSG